MSSYLYLKVVGEPFQAQCMDWRQRYYEAREAYFAFAKSLGAESYFANNMTGTITAITLVDPVPEGWRRAKVRAGQQDRLVPKKGNDAFAGLPIAPDPREFEEITGVPTQIAYFNEAGERVGIQSVGNPFFEFQLLWLEDQFFILTPDFNKKLAEAKAENPGSVFTPGEPWVCPDGLEIITEAQFDLAEAQWRVEQEAKEVTP